MTSPPVALMNTDVPGLDALLGGGITPDALVLVIGAPGAGKTVLSSQIIFAAVRQGLRALILTSYSEGNVKYLNHVRPFAFFDDAYVGDVITLLSMQSLLTGDSGDAADVLMRTIRAARAQIVLLDGFQGIAPALTDSHMVRTALAKLAVQTSFLQTRLLVTLAGNGRDSMFNPEVTTADLVLSLSYQLRERRHERSIEVVKQRGRAPLPGDHSYMIDTSGVRIFPRIEVYPKPNPPKVSLGRARFGLPGLDAMLGGGLNQGTTTILVGTPGAGKTTLGLHWALNEASPKAQTVFVSTGEFPDQLVRKADVFGLPLQQAIAADALRIISLSPVDLNPDMAMSQLLAAIDSATTRRLVIDDMSVLLRVLGTRAHSFLAALRALLYGWGVTALFLLEIAPFDGPVAVVANTPVDVLAENMVLVQQGDVSDKQRRTLAVLRMRFSDYDRTPRELLLKPTGIEVLRPE
ncbi:MAG: AAA family ATPase [Chloroflexales bacterium]|nr:AAA family ATPase [Chloroflexales bacterium]